MCYLKEKLKTAIRKISLKMDHVFRVCGYFSCGAPAHGGLTVLVCGSGSIPNRYPHPIDRPSILNRHMDAVYVDEQQLLIAGQAAQENYTTPL
jgi:hypothetical protein